MAIFRNPRKNNKEIRKNAEKYFEYRISIRKFPKAKYVGVKYKQLVVGKRILIIEINFQRSFFVVCFFLRNKRKLRIKKKLKRLFFVTKLKFCYLFLSSFCYLYILCFMLLFLFAFDSLLIKMGGSSKKRFISSLDFFLCITKVYIYMQYIMEYFY